MNLKKRSALNKLVILVLVTDHIHLNNALTLHKKCRERNFDCPLNYSLQVKIGPNKILQN